MNQNKADNSAFQNKTIIELISFWETKSEYYKRVINTFKPLIQIVDILSEIIYFSADELNDFIFGLVIFPYIIHAKDSEKEKLSKKFSELTKPVLNKLMKHFKSAEWKKALIDSKIDDFELAVKFREHIPGNKSHRDALLQFIIQQGLNPITEDEIIKIDNEFLNELDKKAWKGSKQYYEQPDSALDWATIFYYADGMNLVSNSPICIKRMKQFMSEHSVKTTLGTFKMRYYDVRKRINKLHNYPIEKLEKLLPFLMVNYKETVTPVVNDIKLIKDYRIDN